MIDEMEELGDQADEVCDAIGSALYHSPLDWYDQLERGYPSEPRPVELLTDRDKEIARIKQSAAAHAWKVISETPVQKENGEIFAKVPREAFEEAQKLITKMAFYE